MQIVGRLIRGIGDFLFVSFLIVVMSVIAMLGGFSDEG